MFSAYSSLISSTAAKSVCHADHARRGKHLSRYFKGVVFILYGLRPQMLPTPCVVCMTHILGFFEYIGKKTIIYRRARVF